MHALQRGPMHGYAIAQTKHLPSDEVLSCRLEPSLEAERPFIARWPKLPPCPDYFSPPSDFYSVARRTQEIGIRMALGATRVDISRLILFDSARLIVTGSVIGLLIAILVTRPLAIFLMLGQSASHPLTFVSVLLVLALTGLIANWGPLRRAMTVDPAVSLRYE